VDQFYRAIVQMSYRATPIGCILTFPVYTEIDGYVVTNFGGNLSRETYDLLFKVYGTKFNTASTAATQFGIPDMQHRFFECAATLQEIGAYVAPGLPNIPGHLGFDRVSDGDIQDASGCYRLNGYSSTRFAWANNGESYRGVSIYMDASRVSDVFGASETVQPSAMRALILMRAY